MELTEVDRDALSRALGDKLEDAEWRQALPRTFEVDPERTLKDLAIKAAYSCQTRNLKCKPWESPPMFGDAAPEHDGHVAGAKLLKRLLDAGLSRYEPDPIAALAKVEPPAAA
jgi:hypothetical protein